MSSSRQVTIALTDEQLAQVARQASGSADPVSLLTQLDELDGLRLLLEPVYDDARYSRSTCRALLVLAAFPPDGSERELKDVARELEFSTANTHRYAITWLALGLLEQEPRSRRYRRALAHSDRGKSTPRGNDAS